jgi:hypothetical protein
VLPRSVAYNVLLLGRFEFGIRQISACLASAGMHVTALGTRTAQAAQFAAHLGAFEVCNDESAFLMSSPTEIGPRFADSSARTCAQIIEDLRT